MLEVANGNNLAKHKLRADHSANLENRNGLGKWTNERSSKPSHIRSHKNCNLTPASSATLSTRTSKQFYKMSGHPFSNAFVYGSTNTHDTPNGSVKQRSHLDEIRRLIGDCRSEGCTCGAASLYARFNSIERHMEAGRRHHRTPSGPCMNVRHIRGYHDTMWEY